MQYCKKNSKFISLAHHRSTTLMEEYMNSRSSLFFALLVLSIFYSNCIAAPLESLQIVPAKILNHQFTKSLGHSYILDDYSIFVAKKGSGNTIFDAVLFFTGRAGKEAIAKKMVWILASTNAQKKFITAAKKRFPLNSLLENDNFIFPPVKSYNKEIHRFSLFNTGNDKLYILTYRRLKPKN